MTRKDEELNKQYHKNYYHEKQLKQIQTDRKRLNYWRKKYMSKFNCSLQDCKDMMECELRDEINTGLCSV